MPRILLVEDDAPLAMGLVFTLQGEGYQCVHAATVAEAERLFTEGRYDLVLLDVMLPDGNGYDLCRKFRALSTLPIIFLTSYDDEVNIVMGLDGGGDDYVAKPFQLKVLLSRIKAHLRRAGAQAEGVMVAGNLAVDREGMKARVKGTELPLTATELRLLAILIRQRGQTVTRTQLLDRLWDVKGEFVDDNTLSVHVRHLREKLRAAGADCAISTIRGIGYSLEVEG